MGLRSALTAKGKTARAQSDGAHKFSTGRSDLGVLLVDVVLLDASPALLAEVLSAILRRELGLLCRQLPQPVRVLRVGLEWRIRLTGHYIESLHSPLHRMRICRPPITTSVAIIVPVSSDSTQNSIDHKKKDRLRRCAHHSWLLCLHCGRPAGRGPGRRRLIQRVASPTARRERLGVGQDVPASPVCMVSSFGRSEVSRTSWVAWTARASPRVTWLLTARSMVGVEWAAGGGRGASGGLRSGLDWGGIRDGEGGDLWGDGWDMVCSVWCMGCGCGVVGRAGGSRTGPRLGAIHKLRTDSHDPIYAYQSMRHALAHPNVCLDHRASDLDLHPCNRPLMLGS